MSSNHHRGAGTAKAVRRAIALPDGAAFFREQGCGAPMKPISLADAQSGDIVVLPDRRAGAYLGDGTVMLQGGEWAEFALAALEVEVQSAVARSLDPLTVCSSSWDTASGPAQ
jgi:hypothetical protein